jgi:DNA-binding MarR family transcriptional regulator
VVRTVRSSPPFPTPKSITLDGSDSARFYLCRLRRVPGPRITAQTAAVLAALLAREEAWGFELSRETGLKAGTMYPILARLQAAGWVEDRWEDLDAWRDAGRPPRRYYRLTTTGRARAAHATAATSGPIAAPRPEPGTAT